MAVYAGDVFDRLLGRMSKDETHDHIVCLGAGCSGQAEARGPQHYSPKVKEAGMIGCEFDIEPLLSEEARNRSRIQPQLSNLIMKFAGQTDVIGMHGGLPASELFPISAMSLSCTDPEAAGEDATHIQTAVRGLPASAQHPAVDPGQIKIDIEDPEEITALQQYNLNVRGHGELRAWLRKLVYHTQQPARNDLDLMLVPSCNASLDAFLHMLLNPGDPVLVEEHMYCAPLDTSILPRGCKPQPVAMDSLGMRADGLLDTIQMCVESEGVIPKVLYLVPSCQNPTGSTMTLQRKRSIYRICQQHNIVILEDDPYSLIQFPSHGEEMPGLDVETGFLQVDTDGRVIRVDSFSKIVAPGLRLAWVTTTPKNLSHCLNASFMPTLGPSPLSQAVAYSLLSAWTFQGFEEYIKRIQAAYHKRAAKLAAALEEECGDRVVVRVPTGGMFLWVEFPSVQDTEDLVPLMTKHKVALVPGKYFSPKGKDPDYKCKFARLAYSFLPPEMFREGARRVAAMLDEFSAVQVTAAAATAPAA